MPSHRRVAYLRGLVLGLLAVLVGCASPPTPKIGCKVTGDCAKGSVCIQEECKPSLGCETDADCQNDEVASKLLPPPGHELTCTKATCDQTTKVCKRVADVGLSCPGGTGCEQFSCNADGQCKLDESHAKAGFCRIGTACHAKGDAEEHGCKVCDPTANPVGWSLRSATETCADDADGLPCTLDTCDGKGSCATHTLKSDTCGIDGKCQAKGDIHPQLGDCSVCDPTKSQTAWTLRTGETCSADTCHIGTCLATGKCETSGKKPGTCFLTEPGDAAPSCQVDGQAQKDHPCLVCNAAQPNDWFPLAPGSPCPSDDIGCTVDQCDASQVCVHSEDSSKCADKAGPCTAGVCDAAQKGCIAQFLPTTATCTDLDGIACTLEHCDGKGTCDPKALTFDAQACEDGSPCTEETCDPKAGCAHTPQDSKCDDGNVCTLDSCAGKSGCVHTFADGTACDADDLACTVQTCSQGSCKLAILEGTCAIDGACHAKDDKAGGGCQVCDPTAAKDKWTLVGKGVTCEADSLACTDDLCDGAGSCTHDTVKAGTCFIAGKCQAGGDATEGGCQVCEPAKAQTAWTLKAVGTGCASDSITCTVDQCNAAGQCAHVDDDTACQDSVGCVTHQCKPLDPLADKLTGCFKVDTCPWGHSCDAQKNACLTGSVKTLPGVTGQPTNPAVVRHVLDAKAGTHRTWVVYQDAPVSSVVSGGWQITGKAGLHALILDDVVAPAEQKPLPPVVTLPPALAWKSSATVAQAYPVVTGDPLDPAQAWLSWLEADPAGNGCLTGGGVGGYLRLARLDGTAVKTGDAWAAVAGEVCSNTANSSPMFMTQGFALLDATGAAVHDPTLRGLTSLRPNGTNLQTIATAQVDFVGPIDSKQDHLIAGGPFSKVHPVIVDTVSKSGPRYYGLSLVEKGTTTVNRKLWALPIDATGLEDDATTWLSGNTPATSTSGDLDGVTAVCSLDATVNSSGTVGIVLVVRRAGNDEILLAERDVAGKVTVTKQGSQASFGGCEQGWASARITPMTTGWYLLVENTDSSGTGGTFVSGKSGAALQTIASVVALTTDSSGAANVPALAWRGLASPVVSGPNVTLVLEAKESVTKLPVLRITTFQP